MPRSPIGIELRVCCFGKCGVGLSPLLRCCRSVDGGADERVAKLAALTYLEEPGCLCGVGDFEAEIKFGGSTNEQEEIAERLRSSQDE
jgi:hypothetical protein